MLIESKKLKKLIRKYLLSESSQRSINFKGEKSDDSGSSTSTKPDENKSGKPANATPEEIAKIIDADAVCYQSIEGLVDAIGSNREELCLACITGKYPTPLAQKIADEMKSKFMMGYKEKGRIYEIEADNL